MKVGDELFGRIAEGDIRAFEILYKALYPKLFAYCRKYIQDPATIEDILQDAFIKYLENRQSATSVGFIVRIVHNLALNHIRDSRPTNKLEDRLTEMELSFWSENNYSTIFFKDIQSILEKEIEQLPPQGKTIFKMSRQEGLTNEEIAQKLNISVRTVENQIYRTLKILKKSLSDYLYTFLL